jgi:hypothetical protein
MTDNHRFIEFAFSQKVEGGVAVQPVVLPNRDQLIPVPKEMGACCKHRGDDGHPEF